MTATFSQQATSITLVDKDPFGPGYNGIKELSRQLLPPDNLFL